jgi:hypothetical protein
LDFSLEDFNPEEEDVVSAYKVMHQTTRGEQETTKIVMKTFLEICEANRYAQKALRTVHWSPDETIRGLHEKVGKDNLYSGYIVMGEKEDLVERVWVEREVTYKGSISDFEEREFDFGQLETRRVFIITVITPGADGKPDVKNAGFAYVRSFANHKAAKTFLEFVRPKTANIDQVQQHNNETIPQVQAQVERSNKDDVDLEFESDDVVVKVDTTTAPVHGPRN